MSILKEAEDRIRELIDDLLGRHSHGPDVIERHAAELKQVANSLAAAQAPADEQPSPPPLDAVEEGAEPNSTADDAEALAEDTKTPADESSDESVA